MRWFKHYTDNHKGKSIQFLFDSFGYFGVAGYYILLEMCAEKLEQKSDESLTEVDLLFSFHQRIVRQNLRTSLTNLRRLLDQCQTLGLLKFEISSDLIEIKMPILLNLLDSDQKKPRLNRVTSANSLRLEKSRIEKIREDKEKEYIAPNDKVENPSQSAVAVVDEKTGNKVSVKISSSLEIKISSDLVSAWSDTYPKEFLELELKNARNWVLSNPHKAPKSAWGRFLNSWFQRGWERYRTTLKSQPVKLTADDLNEILGAEL